jgi:hypothetical protein
MKGGRSFVVFAALGAVVLLAGLAFAFLSGDENEAYVTLGRNVTGAKSQLFEGFWMCAFHRQEDPSNNEELADLWDTQAEMGGPRFATQLNRECISKLTDLQERLEALIPPDDMRRDVNALISATRALRGAVSDFVAFLETQTSYEREDHADRVRPVARGWYEFRAAYGLLNDHLRTRIE